MNGTEKPLKEAPKGSPLAPKGGTDKFAEIVCELKTNNRQLLTNHQLLITQTCHPVRIPDKESY